jgi:cell division FtsZ-interacting protein ZapD
MAGLSSERADELIETVQGILDDTEQGTLQAALLESMDRSRKCLTSNREYTG